MLAVMRRYHLPMTALQRAFGISRLLALFASLLVLGACATRTDPAPLADPVAGCRVWLAHLDQRVEAHAVRDGGAHRPDGFPFLRVSRWLASFRDEVDGDEARWQAWGDRLRALDGEARGAEIDNLPPAVWETLGVADAAAAKGRVRACGERLWDELSSDTAQRERERLRRAAVVPDDYSVALRALGMYPLSRLPFFGGVEREQRHWQTRWDAAVRDGLPDLTQYRSASPPLDPSDARRLVRRVPRDALGIPLPDDDTARRLLAAYAPVLQIQTASGFDRPGRLLWGTGPAPEVNTADPVVYQRIAHTRHGRETLMQLVYSVWFTERPPRSGLDLLAGRVDALVLRLTLSADGEVLLLDSIHGCGCYHVFVPTPALALKPAPDARTEWAFVPATLPAMPAGQRLRVLVSSADHQMVGVRPEPAEAVGADAVTYALADEDGLRSLPTAEGARRSAFWSSGIMPGTERGERALFWPMGISSPGAMRQWGRHPTAFVGRRHFDDARLIEQRFERTGGSALP